MKKIQFVLLGAMAILLVAALFLMREKTDSKEKLSGEKIRIGAILELTGKYATQGEASKNGIELAIQELNAKGGILGKSLEVIYEDSQGDDPKAAISAFNKLVEEGVKMVIGPNLAPSGAVLASLAEERGVVLMSPSVGSDNFLLTSKNTFNPRPPDQFSTYELAEYVYRSGLSKVVVFASQQNWEKQQAEYFIEKFTELGGKVVGEVYPLASNLDLRAETQKLALLKPDAWVFTNYGQTGIAAKRSREIGVKVPFFSTILTSDIVDQADGALEGTVVASNFYPSEAFVQIYQERFGAKPNYPADTAYDSVRILAQAVEMSGGENALALIEALSSLKSWNGASGNIHFDDQRRAQRPTSLFSVVSGSLQIIK